MDSVSFVIFESVPFLLGRFFIFCPTRSEWWLLVLYVMIISVTTLYFSSWHFECHLIPETSCVFWTWWHSRLYYEGLLSGFSTCT